MMYRRFLLMDEIVFHLQVLSVWRGDYVGQFLSVDCANSDSDFVWLRITNYVSKYIKYLIRFMYTDLIYSGIAGSTQWAALRRCQESMMTAPQSCFSL